MSRALLAIAGVLMLATACGPLHQLPAAQATPPPGTIPWLPLPAVLTPIPVPSPQAAPVPAGTPACRAAGLAGAALGSQGATGHVITTIAFAGTGSEACYLEGTPTVTALNQAGQVIAIKQQAPFFPPQVTGPQLVEPGPAPVQVPGIAVKYGWASFSLDWVSQPEACQGQSPVTIASVRVGIPAGGSLPIAMPTAPAAYACAGLGVGSFESPPVAGPPAAIPSVPVARISLLGSAIAGKPFAYLVTLTNDTKSPMDLVGSCPSYEEEMFADIAHGSAPLGGKHFYMLNCSPAGTLTPGGSQTFEIVFPVPANATPQTYTLLFSILVGNRMNQPAQATVVVKAA